MDGARDQQTLRLSRRLGVETPEHVVLEYELAGVGSRAAAALLDVLVIVALLFLVSIGMVPISSVLTTLDAEGWAVAVWIALIFLVVWGYFVFFEGLSGGRTPGKRKLGIRVVMDTGHPVTLGAAAIRNLLRLVDIQPVMTYLVGVIFVFFRSDHKRLGDLVAGTIVVRDRTEDLAVGTPAEAEENILEVKAPQLSDDEFHLLEQFLERLDGLAPDARMRLTTQLTSRFAERLPQRELDPEAYLVRLRNEELSRRRSRIATRSHRAARASGSAERFVALRRPHWERFRAQAAEIERIGLRRMSGAAVRRFAADYREIAADLARARTYGVDGRGLDYLERLVSAGHNALYGMRGGRRYHPGRLFLRDLPAAVVRARGYVLTAFVIFAIPAVVGFLLLRERPDLAYEVLPHEMIERAEAGLREAQVGRGYAQMPPLFLPIVASQIITNNVQVAFLAFAMGITAGIGTVVVLALNGLFLGSVLGLFANYGLAGWLITFVAGHGVLELTAIFIAGGAGLLIGQAVVSPGDLSRRDALRLHGRAALRLVVASASLLLLAGIIEGFLSASDAPFALKLGVSMASALLLVLYFTAGRHALRSEASSQGNGMELSFSPRRSGSERPAKRVISSTSTSPE
jgi:uncharacterized membrane protein SpoIIM required for sporulation/uncharacterized RDD family membrane protein YckC